MAVDMGYRPLHAPGLAAGALRCPEDHASALRTLRRFRLSLMLNNACDLRYGCCYVGRRPSRTMAERVGRAAVRRAVNSVADGGTVELDFAGGEPLLATDLVSGLAAYAWQEARPRDVGVALSLTTNGTVANRDAWTLMAMDSLRLTVCHDGLPEVQNSRKRFADGCATSARVVRTIRRLCAAGRKFTVLSVVRPDSVDCLTAGIDFLYALGVRRFGLRLDAGIPWSPEALYRLGAAVSRCARIWRPWLPGISIDWFDDKVARLHGAATDCCSCPGAGGPSVAIAPSGNLYPCERLIGDDENDNPSRLPGHALHGADFVLPPLGPAAESQACAECGVRDLCIPICPCDLDSSGRPRRTAGSPGCVLNRACAREAVRSLIMYREGDKP